MCCLKYEEEVYEELNKTLPNIGDIAKTIDGIGEILTTSVLTQTAKIAVRKTENEPIVIGYYKVADIEIIKSKKPKKGDKTSQEQGKSSE